jgi:outer membrane protein assembly factor BamE
MKRNQVRDILGTPLLASVFHADRWDYVFTFKRQGSEPQSRKVTVFFEGDVLMRVDADALPSEAEFVTSLDSGRVSGPVPVLEMPAAKLQPKVKPVVPSNAAPLPALPSSYPPLEPGEY